MSKALLSVMSATFVAAFVFAISPAHADDDRDYYQQHRRQFISYEKAASIAARAVKGGVVTDLEFDHDRRGDHFDADVRDFLIQAAVGFYRPFDETDTQRSLALDCGLWAMAFMLAAENAGWQTVPMTGYRRDGLRRVLNLPEHYLDVMLIAIGKGVQRGHRTLRQDAAAVLAWNALPE